MARRAGHKELQPCRKQRLNFGSHCSSSLENVPLSKKTSKQTSQESSHLYSLWSMADTFLCTEVPPCCGRMSKLCLHDPELRRWEDTEVSLTLTWGALKKVHVHSPTHRHVCTDFGPLACAALKVHTLT